VNSNGLQLQHRFLQRDQQPKLFADRVFPRKSFSVKKLQNRRNLSLRRGYALAQVALGRAPFAVIRQEELG
jgi:hypothetical protein